jgi:hypothetical protein
VSFNEISCPFYCHWIYFMDIWYILWSFGIFYGHLVNFMVIWYILYTFGKFYGHLVNFSCLCRYFVPRKSGNPEAEYDKHVSQQILLLIVPDFLPFTSTSLHFLSFVSRSVLHNTR